MGMFLKRIVEFLSNSFEVILSINFFVVFFYVFAIFTFRLFFSSKKDIRKVINNLLYELVCVGQVIMILTYGYVYWINYQIPLDPFIFPDDVQVNTTWVRQHLTLYFVIDDTFCSIDVDGANRKDLFKAESAIREYHMSRDGKHILVSTKTHLYLLNRQTLKVDLIDQAIVSLPKSEDKDKPASSEALSSRERATMSPGNEEESTRLKAVISGIRWSPTSRHFSYEVSRWSKYSGQSTFYIYQMEQRQKKPVKTGSHRLTSLRWDDQGQNLYYLDHEVKNMARYAYPYELKVYQLPLDTLKPNIITRIPSEKNELPIESLGLRDIDLYLEGDKLVFKRQDVRNYFKDDTGPALGIDDKDYLYLKSHRWFRKRLMRIPRRPDPLELKRHQFKGGRLMVTNIRWLPEGKYIIAQHQYLGTLIINPWFMSVGQLSAEGGAIFGWYYPVTLSSSVN